MSAFRDPQTLQNEVSVGGEAQQVGSHPTARATPVPVVVERRVVWVDGPPDERIAAIADAQEGRVARWQLVTAELSRDQICWRRERGLLLPEHRGVYAYGHSGDTQHSAEVAALLTRRPGALICAHRAAGMYGFRALPSGVDLLVPQAWGGGHRADIRIHRSNDPVHLTPRFFDGIPVVAPAYALLEIAPDLTKRALEIAVDEAFATGRVNRDELRAVAAANPSARGVGVLNTLLGRRIVGNPSGSVRQDGLLAVVRAAGLPDPEMDAQIGGGFSADMFWRNARLAVEYDSFQWHRERTAWARDRRKTRYCQEHGIELVRVTDEDLTAGVLKLVARLAWLIASRG